MQKTLYFLISLTFVLAINFNQALAANPDSIPSEIKRLQSLPYLQGYVKAPEQVGLRRYNRHLAQNGYNLFTSAHELSAFLMDMKGVALHHWQINRKDLQKKSIHHLPLHWESTYLYPNGDLLAIFFNGPVLKLDQDSRLIWFYDARTHHDIDVDKKGNIYLINSQDRKFQGRKITDDTILILNPDGKRAQTLSLLKLIQKSKDPAIHSLLKDIEALLNINTPDVFHVNTVQVIHGVKTSTEKEVFKDGNILINSLNLNIIMVIDPAKQQIVWTLGIGSGLWERGQHNVTLLPNGHMLSFDNEYLLNEGQSRVFEFDPIKKVKTWEYTAPGFSSINHGSQQRLKNGNTLIVESTNGRVIEVTKDKEIVWEYISPYRVEGQGDLLANIYTMRRIEDDNYVSWLK